MDHKIEITTLRTLAGDCPDEDTCPSIHVLKHQPNRRYVVLKKISDPTEALALAHLVAEDELVGWTPDALLPEV